jgi:quercetin dioxygenase-like cupin family protein
MAMRKRWIQALLIPVVAVAAAVAVYAGTAHATPQQGFSGTTLAKATFGNIRSHVQTKDPQFWNEVIHTEGESDLYVQENTWQPGGSTGWHTHPGPSFVTVTQGSVTAYDGDDPECAPHVYTANTPNNSFVDPGDGHVHIIRNETNAVAKTIAVQLVPAGAVRRVDAPAPGNCAF